MKNPFKKHNLLAGGSLPPILPNSIPHLIITIENKNEARLKGTIRPEYIGQILQDVLDDWKRKNPSLFHPIKDENQGELNMEEPEI